ncbi:hypothetical protein D7I47_02310 [Protaetiibacter intestinalis]|uniref:HNH nuclease domain-containing protein n=1 Tax=Protaetiibacter intestinalis TaxID=2419774 RepID=A0A387B113_9MICO|nr:hypothetical protein D7I47_02310 [Protaetiibacter intestinalis]
MKTAKSRLGPVEKAIQARDAQAVLSALSTRAQREPSTGCLRWTGNRRPNGYGMTGRGTTNRLVHRTVAWAVAGFPGEMRDFPPVHHLCGTRDCLEPTHVRPATALINVLEASVRNAVFRRVRTLEDALRSLQPDHPALTFPPLAEAPEPLLRAGRVFETPRERLKRKEARDALASRRRENATARFRQVIEVQQLTATGTSERDALVRVGLGRRVYQHWANELKVWLEEDSK